MSNDRSTSVISNFLWRFLERSGAQIVAFVVSIVLARLLAPEVYGSVALVTVIITFLQVFVDSGLGVALIQKKNADDLDFSTVFYFNLVICSGIYALVFLAAPFIADFYNDSTLTAVIRVLSLMIVVSGVKNVQQSYVSKHLLFKRFFFSTLGGTIIGAVIGIWMAYMGLGIWALVAQQLSSVAVGTAILWATVKWRPKWCFSFKRLKGLFSYGWKLLISSLIEAVYLDARQLIIGKMYQPADLAFYNKGSQFPQLIVSNVNVSIDSVLLPVMSQVQDDKEAVKAMTRRAIRTSVYIMAPLLLGLAVLSDKIVALLLTETWLPCVPYLIIFCFTYLFYPIHTANLNAIKAMGQSGYFLKLEIMKKILGVSVLLITMWYGPFVMCASGIFTTFISQAINAWPNKKLLNYSLWEQYKDILPSLLLSVIMGLGVWIIGAMLPLPTLATFVIQVLVGIVIYVGLSVIFKIDIFYDLLKLVKSLIKRMK